MEASNPSEKTSNLSEVLPGFAVVGLLRSALSLCSSIIPSDVRTVGAVENEFRRLVDRAIRDMHEDAAAFKIGVGGERTAGAKGMGFIFREVHRRRKDEE
jgi:hypothetical protein